jgi:hypothetical protein
LRGDALHRASPHAELLGDLVQSWAAGSSQGGPAVSLFTPRNALDRATADAKLLGKLVNSWAAFELGEHAHHLKHRLARRLSSKLAPDSG